MSKKRWISSALLLIVGLGLIFSIWKWGEPLLSPLVSNKDNREIIQWAFSIVISLATVIGLIYGFYKFITAPQKDRKKIIDEKITDYNKILWPTSPDLLLKDYVGPNPREITWIDRGALTKEQLLKHTRILLVGRMKSGKSREIAEFIQKRLEEGTFLSSHLYDITEGMRTFDSELIADALKRQLDGGQSTLFYVNDLPRQAFEKQLDVLGEYLKALERCSPGYFLATARSDHLQTNPRLQAWIRENHIHVVELPSLTDDQTGHLVDELAFKRGVQVDPEARQKLCKKLDGTPYHAILTFVHLQRTRKHVITENTAERNAIKSSQEIWLDIQKQVKKAVPLAAAFFEALAVFYRANVSAHPDMVKAYTRSVASARGQRYLPWSFDRRWSNVLSMLEKYDIYIQNGRIQFPDAAAEVVDQISPEEGQARLENFALGYRRFLRSLLLSRFNSQAGTQQELMRDLAVNNYFKEKREKALALIQEAIHIAQPSSVLWYDLGLLLDEKNDLDGAERAYRAALAADEKYAPAWNNLGVLLQNKNDLDGAEAAYRTAVAADKEYVPARNNLGVLLKDKKDLDGAEAAYRTALAADEKSAPAWNNLGVLLQDKNDLDGAERAFRAALAADEKYVVALYNLGLLLQDKNDLDGAEQAYRAAVAADEKYAPAWNNLGVLLKDKGDLEGSEQAYRAVVAADEKFASAWTNLGLLLQNKNDLDGAEQAYRAAVAADEKYAPAWNNLGVLLQNKNDLDGAEQALQAAVAANEKNADIWYNLGLLLKAKKDLDGAELAFRAAVAADEHYASAWYNLGLLLRKASRFAEALPACQQVVRLRPENAYDHAQLGAVYQKLGQVAEAQVEFAEAWRLMSGKMIYNQACIAALCGEVDVALDMLQQALVNEEVTRQWVRQDPDWEDFRANERWIKLTE